jgi:hypothetical protein
VKLRIVLLAGAALMALVWWSSSRSSQDATQASAASPGCPLPPAVSKGNAPLQSDVPDSLRPFTLAASTLKPLAGFSVDARVLSREDYRMGREAELSPTDLALGWGRMREDNVTSALSISQSSRWYRYQWEREPPLPPQEIVTSSANMHMIPADAAVAEALDAIRKGDNVRIEGWLVEASAADGWRWRSSTTREDTGGGACEVIYVCSISRQ